MDKTSLIFKVLSEEASQDEKTELENWIAQHQNNKAEFIDLKLLWDSANSDSANTSEDFYVGLIKIQSRIKKSLSARRRNKAIMWICVIGIAIMATTYLFVTSSSSSGLLRFDKAPLTEVIHTLDREFHINVIIGSDKILKCKFTGTFINKKNDLDLVRSLSEAMDLKYEVLKGNVYRLTGSGCEVDQ